MSSLLGDAAEVLLVVAVGGMLWSALARLRRGQLRVVRCPGCGRTASRAYPECRRCRTPLG
jgi:4-hydroxy-3-methylbut-2-en-1-yl diphosphate synthase IspG/GcpE